MPIGPRVCDGLRQQDRAGEGGEEASGRQDAREPHFAEIYGCPAGDFGVTATMGESPGQHECQNQQYYNNDKRREAQNKREHVWPAPWIDEEKNEADDNDGGGSEPHRPPPAFAAEERRRYGPKQHGTNQACRLDYELENRVHPFVKRMVARVPLGPGSYRLGLQLAVHIDGVDLLIVEAQEILDLRALGDWRWIAPDDIGEFLAADVDGPVRRFSLVGTARRRVGGGQQVQPHVDLRNVVAGRKASLEQEPGPGGLGDDFAAHDDFYVARAVEDVDPMVWVAGVE